MNVVSLDGAFGGFSCAVVKAGILTAHQAVPGSVALEQGLPLLLDTMRLAAIAPADLDLLAVGTGPGGFTGLRIAVSYAKALALGWRSPLAGVSSFDALEYGISALGRLAVISPKAGMASIRLSIGGAQHRFTGLTAESCDWVAAHVPGGELTVTGAPEDVLSGLRERGVDVRAVPSPQPPAVAIAQIAAGREPAPSLHALRADYGEAPPAKVPKIA